MDKGKEAAAIHAAMCNDPRFGYSQDERWGGGSEYLSGTYEGHDWSVRCGDYDCSSSFITAWKAALKGTPYEHMLDGATYTGDIEAVFLASGLFERKPMSFLAEPGDGYLKPGSHVAMCQTQVPDVLSEFSINENGGVSGGRRGDQTGREAYVHGYYSFADRIIHYNHKADTVDKSRIVQLYEVNNTAAQDWHLQKNKDETYTLVNRACGLALDVKGAGKTKGTVVQLYPKNGTDAQKFLLKQMPKTFIPSGGKSAVTFDPPAGRPWILVPKIAETMRVDCVNGGKASGTRLQLWPANRSAAQAFGMVDHMNGYVTLVNCGSGLALDAKGGGK